MSTRPFARPARTARAALLAALTAILLWPAMLTGNPVFFSDSQSYFRQGGLVIDMAQDRLAPATAPTPSSATVAAPSSATVAAPSSATVAAALAPEPAVTRDPATALGLRSLPYGIYLNAVARTLGLIAPLVPAAVLVAWMLTLFTAPLGARAGAAAALGVAGLTTLPFYTAQIMPDIFAGTLILAPMILLVRSDLGFWTRLALLAVMGWSIVSHYSHIPLGMAVTAILAAFWWRPGTRVWAGAAAAMLALALLNNVAVSLALSAVSNPPERTASAEADGSLAPVPRAAPSAAEAVSLAPARVPVLLARTLSDGPGRAYLAETCPDPRFTICELYPDGDFPRHVAGALWAESGVMKAGTPAQARAIANEEVAFVLAVFRAYPLRQSAALARNVGLQLVRIGLDDARLGTVRIAGPATLDMQPSIEWRWLERGVVEPVQWAAVALASAALLGALILRPAALEGGWGRAAFLMAAGLLVNAGICGGLSAPVDRYQGRVIWCLVAMGLAAGILAVRRPAGRGRVSRLAAG